MTPEGQGRKNGNTDKQMLRQTASQHKRLFFACQHAARDGRERIAREQAKLVNQQGQRSGWEYGRRR